MGYLQESDVASLLRDDEFVRELAGAVAKDGTGMDGLADEVADKLSDALEDDPTVRQHILQAAIASPDFKKKVIQKIIQEMG